jgi:glycosyltransferase involved in cell wall biosynthesis
LHICFFSDSLSRASGWGTYSESIVRGVLERGIECTVLATETAQLLPPQGGLRQFPVLKSLENDRSKPIRIFRDHFHVRSLVADCDLVHCLVEPLSPLAATFAHQTRPFIFQAVGTYAVAPLDHPLYGPMWRWAYARASQVPCISAYTQKRVLEKLPLQKTSVVPLGVDQSHFARYQKPARSTADCDQPWPVLLGVGSVKPRKGYHAAIQAVATIKARFPHTVYRIVGQIPWQSYRQQLEALIDHLGLQENVKLLGQVDGPELLRQYAECDVFMLLLTNQDNAFDGFGLVYLEANACGKPVIGSFDSGAETAVADNVSGFLVPQNDPKAAAKAVLRLLENRDLYDKMSATAREWAASMTWDRTVDSLIAIYEQVLDHK